MPRYRLNSNFYLVYSYHSTKFQIFQDASVTGSMVGSGLSLQTTAWLSIKKNPTPYTKDGTKHCNSLHFLLCLFVLKSHLLVHFYGKAKPPQLTQLETVKRARDMPAMNLLQNGWRKERNKQSNPSLMNIYIIGQVKAEPKWILSWNLATLYYRQK